MVPQESAQSDKPSALLPIKEKPSPKAILNGHKGTESWKGLAERVPILVNFNNVFEYSLSHV